MVEDGLLLKFEDMREHAEVPSEQVARLEQKTPIQMILVRTTTVNTMIQLHTYLETKIRRLHLVHCCLDK